MNKVVNTVVRCSCPRVIPRHNRKKPQELEISHSPFSVHVIHTNSNIHSSSLLGNYNSQSYDLALLSVPVVLLVSLELLVQTAKGSICLPEKLAHVGQRGSWPTWAGMWGRWGMDPVHHWVLSQFFWPRMSSPFPWTYANKIAGVSPRRPIQSPRTQIA